MKRFMPIVFTWICLSFQSMQGLTGALNFASPAFMTAYQADAAKVVSDGHEYDLIFQSYYYQSNGPDAQVQYIVAHLALKNITASACSESGGY